MLAIKKIDNSEKASKNAPFVLLVFKNSKLGIHGESSAAQGNQHTTRLKVVVTAKMASTSQTCSPTNVQETVQLAQHSVHCIPKSLAALPEHLSLTTTALSVVLAITSLPQLPQMLTATAHFVQEIITSKRKIT